MSLTLTRPRRIAAAVALGAFISTAGLAAPIVAPTAAAQADAAPCRPIVVPGGTVVGEMCGEPLPQPVRECAANVALAAGAGALVAGQAGAVGGAVGAAAGCAAKAVSTIPGEEE